MSILIGFLILIVLVILGVPIAWSFGAATVWFTLSLGYSADFLFPTAYMKLNGVVILAIPLFILAGGIMERSDIGEALVTFVQCFVGKIKGALCIDIPQKLSADCFKNLFYIYFFHSLPR